MDLKTRIAIFAYLKNLKAPAQTHFLKHYQMVRQLMVHTVRAPLGCSFDSPCVHFVRETYASLVQRGLLVEIQRRKPYGTMTYCRTK